MATLIHRWKLMENANDCAGSLDLTNNGSVAFSADGASFNGTNQWLSFTKTMPQNGTISMWVNGVHDATCPCPFMFWSATCKNGLGPWFIADGRIRIYNATYDSYFDISAPEWSNANWPTGSLTLLTVAYTPTTVVVYRNNVMIGSGSSTGSIDSNGSLGRSGAYSTNYFAGYEKDARIYDYDLTSAEIADLYAAGPNPDSALGSHPLPTFFF